MWAIGKLSEVAATARRLLQRDVRDLLKSRGRLLDDEYLRQIHAALATAIGDERVADAVAQEIARTQRNRLVTCEELLAIIRNALCGMIG